MAPSEDPSNIRVFVSWQDQTVFSGEELKCTITFKNVAPVPGQSRQASGQQQPQPLSERSRFGATLTGRSKPNAVLTPPPTSNTGRSHHRSALSISYPPTSSKSRSGSVQWHSQMTNDGRAGHAHKRSISIVSIGSGSTIDGHSRRESIGTSQPPISRPTRSHNRSASLQIIPKGRPSIPSGPQSAGFPSTLVTSPPLTASYPPDPSKHMRNASSIANPSFMADKRRSPRTSPRPSPNTMPEFSFPAAPAPAPASETHYEPTSPDERLLSPTPGAAEISHRYREHGSPSISERPAAAARILSSTSMAGGTPRSSGEFYSVSNHSSETLASEYVTQQMARGHTRPPHLRRSSGFVSQQPRKPESLMMGYAQVQGSFSLDGSLVSLTPFEQVKKKAVVGGRGGGVVGLEPAKRDNGLLRGFGWGNISTSLGDLLGGGEMSTIKEMRGVANSKSIPLLTTPQSILFVDLQLSPGESRVFEYSFKLPRGLPPTHKGKAVKISYSIVIGTQRAGGVKEQQVRSVEAPFRVLGSVNSVGDILGHDLMNPYVLLRDEAQVIAARTKKTRAKSETDSSSTLNGFLHYVDELVNRPKNNAGESLLSPTGTLSRRPSAIDEPTSSKEAIDLAVMRSNMTANGQQSPNRFEIARNGQKVGVVMLTRPTYRLGEVVTMVIDFADVDIPCYAVHTSLETAEKVDPSLAVRSESSIHRVTRKVYAASSEATLYSRRVVFTPTIPITATPEFVTSGVSLEWRIRVEFVVPSFGQEEGDRPTAHPLLEQISRDEKGGLVLAAIENLRCESFDVPVPLKVYGAVGTGLEKLERDEAAEGLAV